GRQRGAGRGGRDPEMNRTLRGALLAGLVGAAAGCQASGRPVVVASKSFTESVILGDMVAALVRGAGVPVEHRRQLGGTEVVFRALETGAVDVYPEYTGTLTKEILRKEVADRPLADVLAAHGLRATKPLGFDNSYALAMTEERAAALGIRRVSDLAAHPELRLVFSNEVMNRGDGWPGLRARYDLHHEARGMDHDLAYRALANGGADVTDVYTTDPEIHAYKLRVLEDDRHFFATYEALLIYRADLAARAPAALAAFERLEGKVDNATMIGLNERAKLARVPESEVAIDFVTANV